MLGLQQRRPNFAEKFIDLGGRVQSLWMRAHGLRHAVLRDCGQGSHLNPLHCAG